MAYADANTRPNTPSLLVSAGVNIALIGAIFLAGPNIEDVAGPVITEIFTPTPDAPPDERIPPKEKPDIKADPRPFVPPKANDLTPPLGEGLVMPKGGSEIILPPGPSIDPKPFIPTPPAPTVINARPDTRFNHQLQPDYPPGMIRNEREGTVTVRVLIGTDGRVRQVSVIKAETPEFAAVTERHALKKWRFLPATRDGVPFESWREMTVRFEIP